MQNFRFKFLNSKTCRSEPVFRGYPGSQRGPVGSTGARWMYMGTIKHVSGRSAPKGALHPQARPLPGRMHARYAWVYPPGETGVLGEQSGRGRKSPQQWIGVTHVQPSPTSSPSTCMAISLLLWCGDWGWPPLALRQLRPTSKHRSRLSKIPS